MYRRFFLIFGLLLCLAAKAFGAELPVSAVGEPEPTETVTPEGASDDLQVGLEINRNLSLENRHGLAALCYKPRNSVTHYFGAALGGLSENTDDAEELFAEDDPLSFEIGAGVEQHVSDNTTINLGYRYIAPSPAQLDDGPGGGGCKSHQLYYGIEFNF